MRPTFETSAMRVLGGAVLALALALPALALDPSRAITQYARRDWTREDGLPQNNVNAIARTADGYLWVGTELGLARFDGARFVPIPLPGMDGRPPQRPVVALYGDGDTLWVGTFHGLYRFEGRRAVEILTDAGEEVGWVRSLLRDRTGRLWVVSRSGVFTIVEDIAYRFEDPGGMSLEKGNTIAESPDGRVCVSIQHVYCLEDGGFRKVEALARAADDSRVWPIAFDASGRLWAGTDGNGLVSFSQGTVQRWDSKRLVHAVMTDRDGNVWFSRGGSGGLGRIGPHGLEVLPPRPGQGDDDVRSLLEDRDGNVWVGTLYGGLSRLSAPAVTPFSAAEGLGERLVYNVLEDHEGVIWVGTAGGNVYRLEDGRFAIEASDLGDDIRALAEDRQGRLWVGTVGSGVFVREGSELAPVDSPEGHVISLLEDPAGRLWAGGMRGVLRLEGRRFVPVEELRGVRAMGMLSRDPDEVWFADFFGGAVRWRNGEVTHFGKEQGLHSTMGVALYEDDEGVLWIGTHLGGLARLAGETVSSFGSAEGLCGDSVYSILEDDQGFLWMSSNLGVFAVHKEELEAVAEGRATRVACRLFGTADGMRSSECMGGEYPVAVRDRSRQLWFATTDGVVRVDPTQIGAEAPPVVVEELAARGRTYPLSAGDTSIEVPPGRGGVSVRYTALALGMAERTRFRYRLDPFDDDWVEVGTRRLADCGHLSPGPYRFRVQAQVPGSPWSEPAAVVAFRLQPRFYETGWFAALVLVGIVAFVFAGYRTRTAALRRRQRWLEGQVEARTRDLAEVNAALAEINATLERRVEEGIAALREKERMAAFGHLVAGVAHEVRHPIFALRAAAHLLGQKLEGSGRTKEELAILERETERMNRLVDDLLVLGRPRSLELAPCPPSELMEETLASFGTCPTPGVTVKADVAEGLPEVQIDRPAMVQVLINLLHNACHHAAGLKTLVLGAALEEDAVHLTVADDGAGIPLEQQPRIFEPFFSTTGSTGLGLAIAQRLVRDHGGRLSVRSAPGEGTTFTIELPLPT